MAVALHKHEFPSFGNVHTLFVLLFSVSVFDTGDFSIFLIAVNTTRTLRIVLLTIFAVNK